MCSSKPKAINVSNEQLPAVPSVAATNDHHDDGQEEDDVDDETEDITITIVYTCLHSPDVEALEVWAFLRAGISLHHCYGYGAS